MSKSKTKHHHLDGEPVMALNCGDFGGFFFYDGDRCIESYQVLEYIFDRTIGICQNKIKNDLMVAAEATPIGGRKAEEFRRLQRPGGSGRGRGTAAAAVAARTGSRLRRPILESISTDLSFFFF